MVGRGRARARARPGLRLHVGGVSAQAARWSGSSSTRSWPSEAARFCERVIVGRPRRAGPRRRARRGTLRRDRRRRRARAPERPAGRAAPAARLPARGRRLRRVAAERRPWRACGWRCCRAASSTAISACWTAPTCASSRTRRSAAVRRSGARDRRDPPPGGPISRRRRDVRPGGVPAELIGELDARRRCPHVSVRAQGGAARVAGYARAPAADARAGARARRGPRRSSTVFARMPPGPGARAGARGAQRAGGRGAGGSLIDAHDQLLRRDEEIDS